jgi:predicted TPR repeat methyltransferase
MKPITSDDVFDLMDSYITSAAVNAAMELGLFWLLAERPLDVAGVASALGIPHNRCRYWLQFLSRIGLLERVSKGYAPSSIAQTAILDAYSRETWAFLAREARDRFPAVLDLALHIREPGSAWAAQGLTPPDYFAQIVSSPARARQFTRMLYELHLPLADELASALDMTGVRRLMDLGGGSGVMSLALLRRHPDLTAVVVDIANVCVAGREIARENALEERITYHEMDFLRDELPSGFDMVLQCDVGPYGVEMLRKLRACLNAGGRLVTVDQFAPPQGITRSAWSYWAFLVSLENPDFTLRTTAEIRDRLAEAGFHHISEYTLPPRGVLRWSSDWVVIESRR